MSVTKIQERRLLTQEEKVVILELITNGDTRDLACRRVHVHPASLVRTEREDKVYAQELIKAGAVKRKDDIAKVETHLIRLLTEPYHEVKTTWVAVMGKDGNPKVDKNGESILRISKREEKFYPQEVSALLQYLSRLCPEIYGTKIDPQTGQPDMLPSELRTIMLDKLKSRIAAN